MLGPLLLLLLAGPLTAEVEQTMPLEVKKCCDIGSIMRSTMDHAAQCVADNETTQWAPVFTSEDGLRTSIHPKGGFNVLAPSLPLCNSTRVWPIFHYFDSEDRLVLLETGWLRHYIDRDMGERHYDYEPRLFCMEKYIGETGLEAQMAVVCAPKVEVNTEVKQLIMYLLDPIFHGINMVLLLITAIIYFILPQLRDLLGNFVTSLCMCLIVVYAADLVRLYRGFSEHVSFLAADIVFYVGLLATFFWLNSMGYYIWKTFRSRNVFLRVTDKRKYCYYSFYVWGSTLSMAAIALFCHFVLDLSNTNIPMSQRQLGFLGLSMFFLPIAFIVLVNVFFYVTTAQAIARMTTYGRIHHKMKYNFNMFILLFTILTLAWICKLMSQLPYDTLIYIDVFAMLAQGVLVFAVCVCQPRVMYLLRRHFGSENCLFSCCRPPSEPTHTFDGDWGEEMMSMHPM
ncbi:probable G-protein coupled receptor Mth-like 5 [Cloeon dipterum]|uniref:probable G-protein coupled receptor Mth-like 5 n=1 Tax=Cloeon dipterum TaxID=197152 RepID=UPI00321FDFB3